MIHIQSPQVVCSMILEMYINQKSCSKIALNIFWGKKLNNRKYGGFLQWDCALIKINCYTGNIIWAPLALKGLCRIHELLVLAIPVAVKWTATKQLNPKVFFFFFLRTLAHAYIRNFILSKYTPFDSVRKCRWSHVL